MFLNKYCTASVYSVMYIFSLLSDAVFFQFKLLSFIFISGNYYCTVFKGAKASLKELKTVKSHLLLLSLCAVKGLKINSLFNR